MQLLFLDYETRSKSDLKKVDSYNYSMDQSTSVIAVSFAYYDEFKKTGKVHTYVTGEIEKAHKILSKYTGLIVAHNWTFERNISTNTFLLPEHFSKPESYVCTMAMSYRYGLPGKLSDACARAGLAELKDSEMGKSLIRKFSVPDRNGNFLEPTKEDLEKWKVYNAQDIRSTIALYEYLFKGLDPYEEKLFRLDQVINTRGLRLDVKSIKALNDKYNSIFSRSLERAEKIGGLEKSKNLTLKSNTGIIRWLKQHGHDIPNAQQPNLDALRAKLTDNKKGKLILEALSLRKILNAKSPTKLTAMLDKSAGEFVYNYLQYYGGHTGRWAGRGFQPHNLKRTKIGEKDFKRFFNDIMTDVLSPDATVELIGKMLRPLIIPCKGKAFVMGDFSGVEARGVMWLSGCKKGLSIFTDGKDPYVFFARLAGLDKLYSPDIARQIGKTAVLGLGYGMGETRFCQALLDAGIDDRILAAKIVKIYRNLFPEVVSFWYDIESAFITAIRTKKEIKVNRITIKPVKMGLKIFLPSGRALYYRNAGTNSEGKFHFDHPRFGKIHVWGGSLVENITQATCRDIMGECMLSIEDHPDMHVVLTVHDEIIAETDTKKVKRSLTDFTDIMNTAPEWAKGFPLESKCMSAKRYGKG